MFQWNFVFPFQADNQEMVLYYTTLEGATGAVKNKILSTYKNAMISGSENFPAYNNVKDPYRAHIKDYTWGSNANKSSKANMFLNMISYNVDPSLNDKSRDAALGYVHYLHGVNPFNMVYLSNMYEYGGEDCVNEFYHSWFTDGSKKWDRVGVSTYGPAPGFLTGGPNPGYNWDGCCPSGCGSSSNNAKCFDEEITPPLDQPDQKSYKDFNSSWPLNSWSVTENSCGYQVRYIRMLSKFVEAEMDCNGDIGGTAFLDTCGICSGGLTGRDPETDPCNCSLKLESYMEEKACDFFISPSGKYTWTETGVYTDTVQGYPGCDSIISIYLEIEENELDATISHDKNILIANETDVSYQWLDCKKSKAAIKGETNQQYSPDENGSYAVAISDGLCADTSSCYEFELVLVKQYNLKDRTKVYPNPGDGTINIEFDRVYTYMEIEVLDLSGKKLEDHSFANQREIRMNIQQKNGFYFLKIVTDHHYVTMIPFIKLKS